jgi:transposase
MPFPRRRRPLALTVEEQEMLERIRRSRTEEKRRTVRAGILLDSLAGLSDVAIARAHQVNRHRVELCIQKCLRFGLTAALGELPRSGKPRRVSDEAIAWVQNCACQKPKDLGYAQELWTYRLLRAHVQQSCKSAGYAELAHLSRSKLHKILTAGELRPHKVRYYVERRWPRVRTEDGGRPACLQRSGDSQRWIATRCHSRTGDRDGSYDEKPGIQAIAQKTPDRPPAPGQHASHTRDYEYKRLGTVSLLAGLDLHTGTVTDIVSDTHKSKDFIAFLKKLDESYPAIATLRLILDNHSAHISKETQAYLATRPQRFQFVFVPKHGSWLNLVENLFSKMARSMLREIRVRTKPELVERIHLYFRELNTDPIVFRWKYKMDEVLID